MFQPRSKCMVMTCNIMIMLNVVKYPSATWIWIAPDMTAWWISTRTSSRRPYFMRKSMSSTQKSSPLSVRSLTAVAINNSSLQSVRIFSHIQGSHRSPPPWPYSSAPSFSRLSRPAWALVIIVSQIVINDSFQASSFPSDIISRLPAMTSCHDWMVLWWIVLFETKRQWSLNAVIKRQDGCADSAEQYRVQSLRQLNEAT